MNADSFKYEYLRNDIYHIWLQLPGLTSIETISLLKKQRKLDRPQSGLKEFIDEIRKDFDGIEFTDDQFRSLDKDDTPPGANPFMTKFDDNFLGRF